MVIQSWQSIHQFNYCIRQSWHVSQCFAFSTGTRVRKIRSNSRCLWLWRCLVCRFVNRQRQFAHRLFNRCLRLACSRMQGMHRSRVLPCQKHTCSCKWCPVDWRRFLSSQQIRRIFDGDWEYSGSRNSIRRRCAIRRVLWRRIVMLRRDLSLRFLRGSVRRCMNCRWQRNSEGSLQVEGSLFVWVFRRRDVLRVVHGDESLLLLQRERV